MITRPLSVLLGGLSVLGVAVLHAANLRRNTVPEKSYANLISLTSTKQLCTSDRVWEIRQAVAIDDVSPDLLANAMSVLTGDLLIRSTQASVALDWASFRAHVFDDQTTGVAKVIIRLDVL